MLKGAAAVGVGAVAWSAPNIKTFGFAPAGVRARYYENTEDAIVMWCNDIQSDDYSALLDRIRERVTR